MDIYDLIVIGGGSGGIGAAITAGREGLKTLWVEKEAVLGGTGVNAWVNVWQPAYCTSRLAPEIFERLSHLGAACLLHNSSETPSGRPIYRRDDELSYSDTLRRWDDADAKVMAALIVYLPEQMSACVREMALETGNIDILTGSVFVDCETEPSSDGMNRIKSVALETPAGREKFRAGWYIDATADIALAVRAGCRWTIGREGRDEYGEPGAPPERCFKLNGWTLCFRIREGRDRVAAPPGGGPGGDWAHIGEMPDGGYYVNLCFQLPGEAGLNMGGELAREFLVGNIFKRWPGVRQAYGLDNYGITALAPRIGVREGPRLVGRYVMTENDFNEAGFGMRHDDIVACCDHALDIHAPGGGCTEAVNGPWGVPFRCLQPVETDNLLVACRGASFTSLAASACRLQRTMMELGEAAALFISHGRIVTPQLPTYNPWQNDKERICAQWNRRSKAFS